MGLKEELDKLYLTYNRREFVHPDPLEFLYNYKNIEDREIAGLISSSLAYGRVNQILKSVSLVLARLKPTPSIYIKNSSPDIFFNHFKGFKHRFTTGDELCSLLGGIKSVLEKYGSLNNCFIQRLQNADRTKPEYAGKKEAGSGSKIMAGERKSAAVKSGEGTVFPAVLNFAKNLAFSSKSGCNSLIPSFKGGSAFKRLNLYLRWMVRKDNVDPGGWVNVCTSRLIIPLDTHIYRISVKLGFTKRKQTDIRTAIEITEALKKFDKNDPVKYDFALTRLGMNKIEEILLKKFL